MTTCRALFLGAALSALLAGGAFALPVEDTTVQITDQGFSPDRVEVAAGQKVVWKNATKTVHTVTSRGRPGEPAQDEKPLFDSGPIRSGAAFEYVFKKAGRYEYHCMIDPAMKGTVIVRAAP